MKKLLPTIIRKTQKLRRFWKIRFFHGKLILSADYEALTYDAVNIDINNICNQRCRFCFNRFPTQSQNMERELFESVLRVFPMTKNYSEMGTGVYLSCLFEPTLHDHFIEFLGLIPEEGRNKCFFTTNFNRHLSEEQLSAILNANLHHINISIETLQEQRFQSILQSNNYVSFRKNLELLEKVYPTVCSPKPALRFISMVLRENRDEICDIVRYCSGHLYAETHELRTPYISLYDNMKWNRYQLMNAEECESVKQELQDLHLPLSADIRSAEELKLFEDITGFSYDDKSSPMEQEQNLERWSYEITNEVLPASRKDQMLICYNPEYYFLRINSSGICTENATRKQEPVPLENSSAFFANKLEKLYRTRADAALYTESINMDNLKHIRCKMHLDELRENRIYVEMKGWCASKDIPLEDFRLIVQAFDHAGVTTLFEAFCNPRPDVDKKRKLPTRHSVGFTVTLKKEVVSKRAALSFLFCSGNGGEVYVYDYPYAIELQSDP